MATPGYILEPPRIGASNSPFTASPNNLISSQVAFDAAFPADELSPRADYFVQALRSGAGTGPGGALSLPDFVFGWSKNEGAVQAGVQVPFQRFGYSGLEGRFKLFPGAPRMELGVLGLDSNSERMSAPPPALLDLVSFPIRVAVGSVGSGQTFDVTLVADVPSFGAPSPGTVELSLDTGHLNWNPDDLALFVGQTVFFQRQPFYQLDESSGKIGRLGGTLVLNPLPGSMSQIPLLRIGSRAHLTVVAKATEAELSANPLPGVVEWAATTGLLRFNSSDVTDFTGQPVFYDGVLLGTFQVDTSPQGTVDAPTPLSPIPSEESDLFFAVSGEVQFPHTVFVDTFTSGKAGLVQVRRSDGALQFSASDQVKYAGKPVYAVIPDRLIEKGVSLRLFRSPIDPGGTLPDVDDVSTVYTIEGAKLAEPMVGMPWVFLPATPLEDQTLNVRVEQGSGSFTGPLQRLDLPNPPAGKGYHLDVEGGRLLYAERKEDVILESGPQSFGAVQLPNFPVFPENLSLERETSPGSGVYASLERGKDFNVDDGSGVITFSQTNGVLLVEGSGSISSSELTDGGADFTNVTSGDLLVVPGGSNAGVYTVTAQTITSLSVQPDFPNPPDQVTYSVYRSKEVLVDRFFRRVPPLDPNTQVERLVNLGAAANSPRLNINAAHAGSTRFRFGKTSTFSTAVAVSTDADFTDPSSLPSGLVEVSLDSGNLNISSADLTGDIYWSRTLDPSEYQVQPGLGFIEFRDRLLEREEVLLRYAHVDDQGEKVLVEERGAFLVSKELVQPHPGLTTTLYFNPDGLEVAASPAPSAYRGGRPQRSSQVSFDLEASSVSFFSENPGTDALPYGPVSSDENVYIDYYVHEALGGEKNVSVLQPPMATSQVQIVEGETSFRIGGDRTSDFPPNGLLRVDGQELYLLGSSTFDGEDTVVTLDQSLPQAFRSDLTNPALDVTSGPIRRLPSGSTPSYFEVEASGYETVARGSKNVRIIGDVTRQYVGGTVVLFSSAQGQDYALVEGSTYEEALDRTVVTLAGGVVRQYAPPVALFRSVRPILGSSEVSGYTSLPPLLDQPFLVFRQVEGEPGRVLIQGVDFSLDASGAVRVFDPLLPNEEVSVLYSGQDTLPGGTRHRASWNFVIVPTVENGLLNQVLKADYSTYAPDTFFWRVETMTNFRGELENQFAEEAKAASPSQGPTLENSGSRMLHEEGNESLFFQEGRLANEDLVARPVLKTYNDAINYLEDFLQAADGRVVGDRDGRFLFDGLLNNPPRTTFGSATNQIDDSVRIYGSVFQPAYQASAFSRFYPTSRRGFGEAEDPSGLSTGDPIFDTGYKPLSSVNLVQRRFPFAMVAERLSSGTSVVPVDSNGSSEFSRPEFEAGMAVEVVGQDGSVLSTGTVSSVTPTSVTLSGPLSATIPAGSTIRLASTDTSYRTTYVVGADIRVNASDGLLTFVAPGDVPPPFTPTTIPAGDIWDVQVGTYHGGVEPYRFPALDGIASDDDGDIQTPLLSPLAKSELGLNPVTGSAVGVGLLDREQAAISGIGSQTQSTPLLTGSLNALGTVITLDSGTFSMTPRSGDLVRVMTGVNGPSSWFRVQSATATSVTLNSSTLVQDSGFEFYVTTATAVTSGSGAAVSNSGTTFVHTGVDFNAAGVRPGHTLVATSGTLNRQRRNVLAVMGGVLIISAPFTADASNYSYRVDNHIASFGGAPSSLLNIWESILDDLSDVLVDEYVALYGYINTVASDIASNVGEVSGSTFEDSTADFEGLQVATTDVLYVLDVDSPNFGLYTISGISTTQLEIEGTFPVPEILVQYRVLRLSVASRASLEAVVDALRNGAAFQDTLFQAKLALQTVPVVGDAAAFATGISSYDLAGHVAANQARQAIVLEDINRIQSILDSTDRLYDKRYAWIDARINLERGLLVKLKRAVENRLKAVEDSIKSLTKLLQ